MVGLSFLLGLDIDQTILLFVHRARPYDTGVSQLIIDTSNDWSFPSGHAIAAFAVAATFAVNTLPWRAAVF